MSSTRASEKHIESRPLNIYERLNEVRKAVKYVQKDAQVANQYKAVTHDQVTSVTREHFVAHGIMVVPSLGESTFENGMYAGTFEVSFINIENPEDRMSLFVEAHGMDKGDKAPGKALSMATKYAILKVLSLETGENEESRADMRKKEHEPDAEGQRILEACTSLDQLARKWKSLTPKQRLTLGEVKDQMKAKLTGADNAE